MIGSQLTLTLVGGPTVLVEHGGLRLLTDPTFDPPGVYQESPVRFEKTSGPALSARQVGRVDAVLLSHDQHLDNLDTGGRAFLKLVPITLTTRDGAQRLGAGAKGLAPFETCSIGTGDDRLFVTATPARHGPVGVEPIVGFALGREKPGDLLYVTGDTVWFDGIAEIAERFSPEVVLLFTGAAEPRGRFHMTMGSEDALEVAHAFPKAALIAAHNEGWAHLRETQDQLAATFDRFGLAHRLRHFERGAPTRFALAA